MDIVKNFEPIFDAWYVDGFIGEGSFGRVYKIYREEFDGTRYYSALKFISIPKNECEIEQLASEGMNDVGISQYYEELARKINEENQIMNKLKGNTNIVNYEDSRVVPKPTGIGYNVFIRMELLVAIPNYMKTHKMTRRDVIKMGIDICRALEVCSKRNIIHRDVKPDNIFINSNGDFKLGDFGIARTLDKETAFMSKKGTYNYMAPEVYKEMRYDNTVDIYSLGMVMYKLLNGGRLPFLPPVSKKITLQMRDDALKKRMMGERMLYPCEAVDELGDIILKACSFDPKDRYRDPADMRDALERVLENESTQKPYEDTHYTNDLSSSGSSLGDTPPISIPFQSNDSAQPASYANKSENTPSNNPSFNPVWGANSTNNYNVQNAESAEAIPASVQSEKIQYNEEAVANEDEHTYGIWNNHVNEAKGAEVGNGIGRDKQAYAGDSKTNQADNYEMRSYSKDEMEQMNRGKHYENNQPSKKVLAMIVAVSVLVALLLILIIYGIPFIMSEREQNASQNTIEYSKWIDGTPPPDLKLENPEDLEVKTEYRTLTAETTVAPSIYEGWECTSVNYVPDSEWYITKNKKTNTDTQEVAVITAYRYFIKDCPKCGYFSEDMYYNTSKCPSCGAALKSIWIDKPYSSLNYILQEEESICLVQAGDLEEESSNPDEYKYFFYSDNYYDTKIGTKHGTKKVIDTRYKWRKKKAVFNLLRWPEWQDDWIRVGSEDEIPKEEPGYMKVETRTVYRYIIREKSEDKDN